MAGIEASRAEAPVSPYAAPPSTPRADFACKKCNQRHDNLPAASQRCPVCGLKRGFQRIIDGVLVSTKGRRIAKFIDPRMTQVYDQHSAVKQDAQKAEKAGYTMRGVPAAAAMGAIDPVGRAYSKAMVDGGLLRRNVTPQWSAGARR